MLFNIGLFMGLRLNSKLFERVASYAEKCGAKSILHTKSPSLKGVKLAECKIKPLCEDVFEHSFSKRLGRILEQGDIRQNTGDTLKLLKLPKEHAGPLNAADASTYVMNITKKARTKAIAETNPVVAENMRLNPNLVKLSKEEQVSKQVIDDAFKKIAPNAQETVEFRGAVLPKKNGFYEQLTTLKPGATFTEPGFMWTSPDSGYAFGRYASKSLLNLPPTATVKYNIILPKGSKMLCVDRANPETLLPNNSKFKVLHKKQDQEGNIELFLENLI